MHSLIVGIANSFTDNLIAEQRYRMILDGLQVTLLLTVRTPHLIPSDALDIEDNMLAAAILRSVSTDIHIEKNALIITVR